MRTLLYTCYNEAYKELADITIPRMRNYAKRHDMMFLFDTGPLLNSISPTEGIYWLKFEVAIAELGTGDYDRVIWLDVDQLITNLDFVLPETTHGFHVPKDWGHDAVEPWHFSVCGFIAHRDSVPLFERAIAMEPEWRGKPFPEQGPMREVVRHLVETQPNVEAIAYGLDGKLAVCGNVHFMDRRPFNCVPEEVCPGKVPEPWQPGDFAAHITMLPIEERVKLAEKLADR